MFGELRAVGLAVAVATGAAVGMARPGVVRVPLGLAVLAVLGALVWRLRREGAPETRAPRWVSDVGSAASAASAVLALGLLALALSQRSVAELDPAPSALVRGEVTLLSDPAPTPGGGVRADVRLGRRRLALTAYQSAAAALDDRLAGERVQVMGRMSGPGPYERQMRHRHLVGRLQVDVVTGWRPGHGVTRVANGLRRTLASGAEALPARQQSLLMGLVLGDDRQQPAQLTEAFRAAGLAHILAVSGQNVAFCLMVVAPVARRLRFAPRLIFTLVVLAGFALLTRGEPSVLRATGMAAVSAWGAATGRPSTGLRTLAIAVTGLLLVDPLLVSSLGFQLSVAGAAGILVAAGPIERWLPGPRWLTGPMAVTAAAQVAVAPLLVAAFGEIGLASFPANLLALPAAGMAMVWGLTGGLVAGLVGSPAAGLLHLPTRLLLGWIEAVAKTAADWPLGRLGALHLVALGVAGVVGLAARWMPGRAVGRVLRALSLVAVVAIVVLAPRGGPSGGEGTQPVSLGPGVELWRADAAAVVVVDGRVTEDTLLGGLRREGADRVDALVVRTDAQRAVTVASGARVRWPSVIVLAPPRAADVIPGAIAPPPDSQADIGRLHLRFDATPDRLAVTVTSDR